MLNIESRTIESHLNLADHPFVDRRAVMCACLHAFPHVTSKEEDDGGHNIISGLWPKSISVIGHVFMSFSRKGYWDDGILVRKLPSYI
jgi:hypothetical protein